MIHGPARFWPILGRNITANDRVMLEQLGPMPFKGFSFYQVEDWKWLREHGFVDVGIRLWHERGQLPTPQDYLVMHQRGIDNCLDADLTPWVQLLNEPNLELDQLDYDGKHGVEAVKNWLREALTTFRAHYPMLEFVSPPIAQDAPNTWPWLVELGPVMLQHDSVGVDYYWSDDADLQPDRGLSPEWYHLMYPNKPIRLLECGGKPGTTREWRHTTYPNILSRYASYPWLKSAHVYILSAEDIQWDEHQYDNQIITTLTQIHSTWRLPDTLTWRIGNLDVLDVRASLPRSGNYADRVGAIQAIVVHHTGVNADTPVEATARYHIEHNGWPGIGYHFYITFDGRIYYCNDWSKASYHVAGRNDEFLGICLTGDFTRKHPTDAQLYSCYSLISNLQLAFGVWYETFGHREVATKASPTSCPGDTWLQWKAKVESKRQTDSLAEVERLQARIERAVKVLLGQE